RLLALIHVPSTSCHWIVTAGATLDTETIVPVNTAVSTPLSTVYVTSYDPGARATMLPPQTGSLNGIVHEPKIVAPWAIVTSVLRFIGSSEVATNAAPLDG